MGLCMLFNSPNGSRGEVLAGIGLTAQDVARRATEWGVAALRDAVGPQMSLTEKPEPP